MIILLLLRYVRFVGVAVLFFSPELLELCHWAWESSCRLSHMRTTKNIILTLPHIHIYFLNRTYCSKSGYTHNSCRAHNIDEPFSYIPTDQLRNCRLLRWTESSASSSGGASRFYNMAGKRSGGRFWLYKFVPVKERFLECIHNLSFWLYVIKILYLRHSPKVMQSLRNL